MDHEINLKIKAETQIVRIITEIEEWRKDQELQRMKSVSEAIIRFQQELTRLNVDSINAIGNMQLDLREKAQNLVYEKTIKYKELQDTALNDAMVDLKRIEMEFGNNTKASNILINAVDMRLANIINTAYNFLQELNIDIKLLNNNINLLAESGQMLIERHLDQFHSLTEQSKKQIESPAIDVEYHKCN